MKLQTTTLAVALLAGTAVVASPALAQSQNYGDRGSQYGSGWNSRGMDDGSRDAYERGFRQGREDERRSRFGSGQYGSQGSWSQDRQPGFGNQGGMSSQGYGQSYGRGGMGSQGSGDDSRFGGSQGYGQSSQRQSSGGRMSEEEIRPRLRERGYSDIENLERNDGRFTADARRYGERVEDLRIDPRSGRVLNQSRLNEDQVKAMLSDRGWSNVRNIERDGNIIEAQARRDGRTYDVRLNARSGEILQRERRDRDRDESGSND
ncbi:PepSY domain-containing protein [Falsiroseomonas bella]|nr:PepSY domain-containing protein [Falsiroseomonas bella]